MAQTTTQSEEAQKKNTDAVQASQVVTVERQREVEQQRYDQAQGYRQLISYESQLYILMYALFIVLLMAGMASLGATWIFPLVYIGVVVSLVAGSLYMIKKLMTP